MTILEKVQQWLQTYPGWEDSLTVDMVLSGGGNTGLFPGGVVERGRREDVLGNRQIQYSANFTIRRQAAVGEDNRDHAAWLLDFQQWVGLQSLADLTPKLGDVPQQETMRAEKGSLQRVSSTGIGTYTVTLTANFIKLYEEN